VMRRVEPRLHACRQFRRIARRLRHCENIEAEISAWLEIPRRRGGGQPSNQLPPEQE
jgi:hypothetical protein